MTRRTPTSKGLAELIIAKHRNGPIGHVDLAFQAPYPRFRNMAHEPAARRPRSWDARRPATSSSRPTIQSVTT